jgi:hypothetical protein
VKELVLYLRSYAIIYMKRLSKTSAFFLGRRRGTCTPKHFVNLMGESKNFKMLEFPHANLEVTVSCVI